MRLGLSSAVEVGEGTARFAELACESPGGFASEVRLDGTVAILVSTSRQFQFRLLKTVGVMRCAGGPWVGVSVLVVGRVLPTTTRRVAPTALAITRRLRLKTQLRPERHDPLMLEQFDRTSTFVRIALEAFLQKVDALLAQLIPCGQLRRIALSNVVHDSPLVVHGGPGATTSSHFKNHAAERPDIHSAETASAASTDYLRGHVHRGTSHGALTALTRRVVFCCEGATLAGNKFCRAKVDKFDHTVVVEEDV